jgi:RNA polymerase sigma-70 factor (ECF subfamily)
MEHANSPDSLAIVHLPDSEIISRVLAGERDHYALLIKKYNSRLYRVCMSILGEDAEAEDAMQVSYIRAFENLEKFESRSSFSTWLTRILINECLLRLKKKKRTSFMRDKLENNDSVTSTVTPLNRLLQSEMKQVLENAIAGLPEKYRVVFVMREIEDMNVAETRECLGLSEANVKVRLNRAKALLRNSLSALYNKEDILSFHLTRCDRVTRNVMKVVLPS